MCGLAAIFAYHQDAPPVDQDELLRMREHMHARGPDGCGLWLSENRKIGLAHRRLSIIDLSESAAQPMMDVNSGNVIVYNGEIYNYQELRSQLEKQGCRFKSTSDTEVLLHLYAEKGEDMIHDLRGMYAFVIYDPGENPGTCNSLRVPGFSSGSSNPEPSLFIARDPYGIKPLYIHDNGKTVRLASQVKALLAGGKIPKEKEPAGHAGFFLWGHVPEPYTLYKNIMAVEPGTTLRITPGKKFTPEKFCSIPEELVQASEHTEKCPAGKAREQLKNSLLDTIRAHLVADVPIGIFLSSGLDSTTITALASEVGADLHTVTLGFEEYKGTEKDEVPLAEEVARQYGAKHRTIWINREEFRHQYKKLLHAMDQPTIDGVNTFFVSMAARKAGLKVALSGLGGDELFGGYPSFSQIPKSVNILGWANSFPGLTTMSRRLSAPIISRLSSPKYAGLLEYGGSYEGTYLLRRALYMPWELSKVMDPDQARQGLQTLQTTQRLQQAVKGISIPHHKVSALETTWYMRNQLLRDADWASMAHSLEVRVPLVDLNLLRTAAPILKNLPLPGKQAMAQTPANSLPNTILNRAKTGFTVPVRDWLADQAGVQERGLRGWSRHIYLEFCH